MYSAHSPWNVEDSLQELALLADTAGLVVVGQTFQRIDHPYARHFIGPGKVKEIAALRADLNFDLLICDDELSPAQIRNLETELDLGVIDRTTLILDIFAQHARTREGRLQVELAQYEYMLPRLKRQWTHLERQAGGGGGSAGGVVGLRGPGETQLEIDRRLIERRITQLRAQLAEVHRQREQYRQRRRHSGVPVISLVGYTNAGKSTLLNALAGADVRAEDRLFATLDPTTRQLALPGGQHVLLTDTVGFIQKLPHQLVAAFRATLEEIREADLLLHVLDITHPNAEQQAQTVVQMLDDLKVANRPVLTVLNKVDRLPNMNAQELARMPEALNLAPDYVPISAVRRWGFDQLLGKIEETLAHCMAELHVLIPYQRNDLVALWHERGVVDEERHEAEGTYIHGRVPAPLASQLAPFTVHNG